MADVFLSYASADRARVAPLVEALQEDGWDVWWDRDIEPGHGFEETIDREIQAATCVVVIWTTASIESRWVRNEALEGLERDVLVPVLLDDVRVPVAFRQSQAIDLRELAPDETDARTLSPLRGAVARHVAGRQALPPELSPRPAREQPSIAVLPLRLDAADDREARFVVEGMVEETTTRLAHVPGYLVVCAGSTVHLETCMRRSGQCQILRAPFVRYVRLAGGIEGARIQ